MKCPVTLALLLLAAALCVSGCGQHPSDKTTATTEKGNTLAPLADTALKNNPAPPADTPLQLDGTWLAEKVERDGQLVPEAKWRPLTFTADGHYTFISLTEASPNEGSFTLDQKAQPKTIDFKGEKVFTRKAPGVSSLGIVEQRGDTLRLCVNDSPTAPRPAEFKAEKGIYLFTLTRKPIVTPAIIEDFSTQLTKLNTDLADGVEKAKDEEEAIAKVRDFRRSMTTLMEKGARLGFSNQEASQIFDKPAPAFLQARTRFVAATKKFPKAMDFLLEASVDPEPLPPGWKEIQPVQKWSGSFKDQDRLLDLPHQVITDAKEFQKLWEKLMPGEKQPDLDFAKVFVIHEFSVTSKLDLTTRLREKGDLMYSFRRFGREIPGFMFLIEVINRDGIHSVNFEPLK